MTRTGEPILAFLLDEDARLSISRKILPRSFLPSFFRTYLPGMRKEQNYRNKSVGRLRDTLSFRVSVESRFFDGSRSLVSRTIDNLEQNRAARGSKLILVSCTAVTVGGTSGPRGGPRAVFHFHCSPVSPRRPRASSNSKLARFDFISARFILRSIVKINELSG